ncbi:MAG TPA: LptF/LptG family permease [Gemmatimonadaceae bacterium]|nr:LptF/LptG family permease [Gemmatimonadaceae bacterium]
MSWARVYRIVLHLLPRELRRKHGVAMETLFARDVERARAEHPLRGALAAVSGVGDVLRRAAYEWVRPVRITSGEPGVHQQLPLPTSAQLLRRHATSFAIAFVALTASLLVLFATRQLPELIARGASGGAVVKVVLLAVPFTAALTIPMAVFVAVLREFTRLGADGTLAAARRRRAGLRRIILPVLAGAAAIGALALVEIAVVVPRANTQLATMTMGPGAVPTGRTMTLAELRNADRRVRSSTKRIYLQEAATYEVEIQKKFALPAACIVLALAGIAIALLIPRGGMALVLGASFVVFLAYYLLIATGESLAHRLVVSPVIGMWGANVLLLALALIAMALPGASGRSDEGGAALVDG